MSILDSAVGAAVARVIDAALDLVPDEEVSVFLSEAARRRANRTADAAELAKFGHDDTP